MRAWRRLQACSFVLLTLCALQATAAAPGSAIDITALRAAVPAGLRKGGLLRFVGDSHPPYRIVSDDRKISDGIDVDLARALGRVLDLRIEHFAVNSLSATLAGLEAGRYDIALGPALATPERQKRFDGVSWLHTKPSFVYPLGRPLRFSRVEDFCGRKVSYVAGSVVERLVARVDKLCVQAALPLVLPVPLVDGNMTLVATQAGRADAAGMTLTAALHAQQVNPQLFAVFEDRHNALGLELVSLFVTKRSGLGPLMLGAMQALVDSGEYGQIMNKWGIAAVAVKAPQLNVVK
jgi:polar amino acid transport system substrate-binding protein